MITTPPGIYLISALINQLTQKFFNCQLSSLSGLRAINAVLGLAVLLVSAAVAGELKVNNPMERSLLVASLPTLYLFNFLYYTDVGSVFFTLLSYYGALKRNLLLYLLAGLVSLSFRQTNIIWVAGFFVGDIVHRGSKKIPLKLSNSRKILDSVTSSAYKQRTLLLAAAILILFFSSFIYWNGGSIVLGDKQSHQVSTHWAQMLYFLAFTFTFFAPAMLPNLLKAKHASIAFAMTGIAFAATRFGTVQHPYLLADNRHWTNVIWRHVLNRRIYLNLRGRHILAPAYGLIAAALNSSFDHDLLWKAGFLLASALSLIPSPLFEPRYYVIPTIILILNMKISREQVRRTLIWLCGINAVVIGVFLYRPFTWPSIPDQLQRYIW